MGNVAHTKLSNDQRRLLLYWRSKASAGSIPYRSDIHPGDLSFCLSNTSILEFRDGGLYFRLTGSSLRDLLGDEFRGRPVTEISQPQTAWTTALEKSLSDLVPTYGLRTLTGARSHAWMRLPLLDQQGVVRFLLCYDRVGQIDDLTHMDADKEPIQRSIKGSAGAKQADLSTLRVRFAA